MHELKNAFRPEFLNRIDEIIVFKSLTEDEIVQIVDLMVAELRERMIAQNMTINLDDAAKRLVAKEALTPPSVPGPCVAPSSACWRIRCPSRSLRAAGQAVRWWTSPCPRTARSWCSPREPVPSRASQARLHRP